MSLKSIITAAAFCSAAVPASAMPIGNLSGAAPPNVEQVRWICGPNGCFWRPGPTYYAPRYYGGYGPRFYGGYGRGYGGYYGQGYGGYPRGGYGYRY
jgi:hypothetical protein